MHAKAVKKASRSQTISQSPKSITVNLGLISLGCIIFVIGMNSVLIPRQLLSGGVVGVAMIFHYLFRSLDVGLIYFVLNIPLVILGWFTISRRFMLYTAFGMAFFSLAAAVIKAPVTPVVDPILAALLAGVICGTGGGIVLRSLGSAGGLDILAIYFNQRWGLRPGTIIFFFNAVVLLAGATFFGLQVALYSIIYVYTSSKIIESILAGFNRRKSMFIISDRALEIAEVILRKLNRGATFLKGEGAYSRREKTVIFTITTLVELQKLKNAVFDIDPEAFVVVNDTLEVLGKRHGTRKVY